MFVRFSCGCIGFRFSTGGKRRFPLVVKRCDADGSDDPIEVRLCKDLSEKTYTPLDDIDLNRLLCEIGALVADGYKLRTIRSVFGSR